MNGLPALLFDGTNDFFSFNGNFLVGSDYTIFVVEARGSSDISKYFLSTSGTQGGVSYKNTKPHFGYRSDNFITQAHYYNDTDKNIGAFKSIINRINSFVFSIDYGKSIYTNGGGKTSNSTQTSPIISYLDATIGNYGGATYYNGTIAEIIFYTRALTDQERQGVEAYLSKKWGIKIS